MNAALFNTTFWHVVWITEDRKPLFRTLEERRAARTWFQDFASGNGLKAHQINVQNEQCQAFLEFPEGWEQRAGEIISRIKDAVELALLSERSGLDRIWDSRNFFERVELGAFGAVRDCVKEQGRHLVKGVQGGALPTALSHAILPACPSSSDGVTKSRPIQIL